MDRQCSSCGKFCKKSGCERENMKPEQEPVAWISKHGVVYPLEAKDEVPPISELRPLYTAPPQQLEQEPVAWMWDVYNGAGYTSRGIDFYPTNIPFAKHIPLYTATQQREWQGMTLEEMHELEKEFLGWPVDQVGMLLINAAQDKLKEKNCV